MVAGHGAVSFLTLNYTSLRVQRDRGVKHLGNRTILLGFFSDAGEAAVVEVWHLAPQGQRRFADF